MPKSFRIDPRCAPPRYRTPSPPRDAVEPISPSITECDTSEGFGIPKTEDVRSQHGLKRPYATDNSSIPRYSRDGCVSTGAMDDFASIALATNSNSLHQTHRLDQTRDPTEHISERPSKRAKSEKLYSPNWSRVTGAADTRPATSYEQSPEDRKLEAELLLNFAQAAAKLTTPSPILPHTNIRPQQRIFEATDWVSPVHSTDGHPQPAERCSDATISNEGVIAAKANSSKLPSPNHLDTTGSEGQDVALDQCGATSPHLSIIDAENFPNICQPQSDSEIPLTLDVPSHDEVDLISESLPSPHSKASSGDIHMKEAQNYRMPGVATDSHSLNEVTPNGSSLIADTAGESRDPAPYSGLTPFDNERSQVQEGDARLKDEAAESSNVLFLPRLPETDVDNESRLFHGALDHNAPAIDDQTRSSSISIASSIANAETATHNVSSASTPPVQHQPIIASAVCTACNFVRNSIGLEPDNNPTSWISCDACKAWFHFACAGFKNEREVRAVDKFRCRKCKPIHGATTYVRKSSRAHSAIDYAGLHQGVIKTSDERPEHHYIKPIKEGTITFLPDTFARMRPELVTAEHFEKGIGMKEPVVIPAHLNPRLTNSSSPNDDENLFKEDSSQSLQDDGITEDWFSRHPDSEVVPDHGQDALDMVVPQGLTVRQVAELYGPEEKVEVIDVKSQNGENKKWNMRRWADYYENPNNKVVRNVISLEVSQSKLGRLIRRPQIVRDLDLQDSVWPGDLLAKGEYPRVQFYCLMSVADCFTDFHIDFGGSSVFYHILKGRKTFLFIPPKEKNLKKYEEWCQSPAQNWTFLGDQTKECYRVDLTEGDTMLIPSGWIHAVWTPEDSLVIGGNFLTRMNFGMQLRVAQVEKATGVARKFRYPHFQKLHWYTALKYLDSDPLPEEIKELLHAGGCFNRERPAHHDFDSWGENSRAGVENYHVRYYSQSELDGLPDLLRYLLRTALIDIGSITEGISVDTRNAVKKSIPRSHGEPLNILKTFAAWCAWKRGNESIPHWAYPDAVPEKLAPDKLSAAATKKLDREAALSAPRRQSARMQSHQQSLGIIDQTNPSEIKRDSSHNSVQEKGDIAYAPILKRPRISSGVNSSSHRKTACESCRKRRRACKHKDQVALSSFVSAANTDHVGFIGHSINAQNTTSPFEPAASDPLIDLSKSSIGTKERTDVDPLMNYANNASHPHGIAPDNCNSAIDEVEPNVPTINLQMSGDAIRGLDPGSNDPLHARPRHKACNDCRKSKRRCIHDAFGNEDPIKVRETAIPRPHARKSNIHAKEKAKAQKPTEPKHGDIDHTRGQHPYPALSPMIFEEQITRMAPVANMVVQPPNSEIRSDMFLQSPKASLQGSIAEHASQLLDPALFVDNGSNFLSNDQSTQMTPSVTTLTSRDQTQCGTLPELSPNFVDQLYSSNDAVDSKAKPGPLEPQESLEKPASSLVSPPASIHDDEVVKGNISPDGSWTVADPVVQHIPAQQEPMQQRYTPDSGSMGGASSSSCGDVAPEYDRLIQKQEPTSNQKVKARLGSDLQADEDSLKLIKELQAQELGLRRRAKA